MRDCNRKENDMIERKTKWSEEVGKAIAGTTGSKDGYTFEQAKEYARKIIDDMAAAKLTYSDAARVLHIASDEVGKRMRNEKVKASQ